MINFIETLFGLAAAAFLAAIVFYFLKKRDRTQKLLTFGVGSFILAVALELYVRYVP